MNRIFIQPQDYLAPTTENEKKYMEMWLKNELSNEEKNKTRLTFLGYVALSTGVFSIMGTYLITSLLKEFESSCLRKMEDDAAKISDRVQQADFKYARTTEISNVMLKIQNQKPIVRLCCFAMGFAYGLAHCRIYLKEEADLIVNKQK